MNGVAATTRFEQEVTPRFVLYMEAFSRSDRTDDRSLTSHLGAHLLRLRQSPLSCRQRCCLLFFLSSFQHGLEFSTAGLAGCTKHFVIAFGFLRPSSMDTGAQGRDGQNSSRINSPPGAIESEKKARLRAPGMCVHMGSWIGLFCCSTPLQLRSGFSLPLCSCASDDRSGRGVVRLCFCFSHHSLRCSKLWDGLDERELAAKLVSGARAWDGLYSLTYRSHGCPPLSLVHVLARAVCDGTIAVTSASWNARESCKHVIVPWMDAKVTTRRHIQSGRAACAGAPESADERRP